MATLYIAPNGAGLKDGSSAANAGVLADLPAFITAAGAGGEVLLIADEGPYQQDVELTITDGGDSGADVTIRGVDSGGNPMAAEIVGSHPIDWVPGQIEGNELFRLMSGADNLTFQDLTLRNFGSGAFRIGADIENLTIQQVDGINVRRFVEDQALDPAATASIDGLVVQDVAVTGYSKTAFHLKYDTRNVLLEDVTGDSERQNGGLYVVGVHIEGTAHDIILRRVEMKNSYGQGSDSAYWNGDGFGTERGTYDIRFEDCIASGNTDAGYDIKSENTLLLNVVSEGNKHNYRIWSETVTLQDSVSLNPVKLGGSGGVSHIELMEDASALIDNLTFSDAGSPAILFDMKSGGALLRVVNTLIPNAYADRIASLKGSAIEIVPPDGPIPAPDQLGNDQPTWITVAGGVLEENATGGMVAATLTAADPDAGDTHSYAITGGAADRFEIVGNQIVVKAGVALDWETRNLYGINVRVTDSAGLSHTQTVIIALTDVRETGTSGNDVLLGGAGGDTLAGRTGNDTYLVNNTADKLVEKSAEGTDLANVAISTYTLANYVEKMTFVGTGHFTGTGNSSNNTITGGNGGNQLDGAGGNDTIYGGLGIDTVIGGTANDKLYGGGGNDTASGGSGNDAVWGDAGDDQLSGNDGVDTLTGGDGADRLDGGGGNDKMLGGTGNDTYFVNAGADLVTELLGEGIDSVNSSITYSLGANVENLTLTGSNAINGTGNTLGNRITGNSAVNSLGGGDGNDVLDGAGGNDKLTGGQGADTYLFNPGGGQDSITNADTGVSPDTLLFGAGIGEDDLWFSKSGSNLVLTVLGSTDKVTLINWYSGASNQLDHFELADGTILDAGDVQDLVGAMAFAAPPPSLSALTAAQQQAVTAAIMENWQQA